MAKNLEKKDIMGILGFVNEEETKIGIVTFSKLKEQNVKKGRGMQ